MKDSKGRFAPGNPGGALKKSKEERALSVNSEGDLEDELLLIEQNSKYRVLKKFKNMAQMTLQEFEDLYKLKTRINLEEAAFMQFFKKMIEQGDVHRMRFYFATYGIPTELKAIAVQEMDKLSDEPKNVNEPEQDLTDEEKIIMLDKMKSLIESKK
jgi:hypothetical protein